MVGFKQLTKPKLGGHTRKEQTREELLEGVRRERELRNETRARAKAALTVQRHWRGFASRTTTCDALLAAWWYEFQPLVARPTVQLPAGVVAAPTAATTPAVTTATTHLAPVTAATESGPATAAAATGRAAAAAATPSPRAPPTATRSAVARTLLGLLLRSSTCPDPGSCYLSLANTGGERSQRRWLWQAGQLVQLCCGCVAAEPQGPPDAVLEAVAMRLLSILTTPTSWKCATPGTPSHHAAAASVSQLVLQLAQHPQPLYHALSRASAHAAAMQARGTVVPGAGGGGATVTKLFALVSSLLACRTRQGGSSSSSTNSSDGVAADECLVSFVQIVLLAPGSVAQLSAHLQERECEAELLVLLAEALSSMAVDGLGSGSGPGPRGSHSCPATPLSPLQAAWGLVSMTSLFAAARPGDGCAAGTGLFVFHLQAAIVEAVVSDTGAPVWIRHGTPAFRRTNMALFAAGFATFGLLYCVQPLMPEFTRAYHVSAATSALSLSLTTGVLAIAMLFAGVPGVLNTLAFAPTLLPTLWRWLAVVMGLPLQAPATATMGLDVASLANGYKSINPAHSAVLGLFCRAHCQLLLVLDDNEFYKLQQPFSLDTSRAIATSLNSLIYHTYLPATPQPAHLSSPKPLPPPQPLPSATGMQYSSSSNTTAAAAAATVSSLNPSKHTASQHGSTVPTGSSALHNRHPNNSSTAAWVTLLRPLPPSTTLSTELISEYAPLVLRSLYERDVRRSYCHARLWLAPYRTMYGESEIQPRPPPPPLDLEFEGGSSAAARPTAVDPAATRLGQFTTGAVLQALLQPGAHSAEEGSGEGAGSASALHPTPALQNRAGDGARPASIASLIRTAPQSVPFSRRVDLFRALLAEDKRRGGWHVAHYDGGAAPVKITVRRSHLMEDAYNALGGRGADVLKARLIITFINETGLSEAGLDYGGLMKEFLEEVIKSGFNADYGLMASTADGLAYPRPSADKVELGVQLLEFLGTMVGKALYEGILINAPFAPFFVARLQGRTPMFDDLQTLDPELHRSMAQVKSYEGDVQDLGLTFTVEDNFLGTSTSHPLVPGGDSMPVTNDNRLLYCHLLADFHLNVKLGRPATAFTAGLLQLIPHTSLR
ncbi:MAG: hypothetical protein WDW36_001442 [Sanguina aurantia]